jgi:serine/threonine protein kinase
MKQTLPIETVDSTQPTVSFQQTQLGEKSPALMTGTILYGKWLRPPQQPGELGRLANFRIIRLLGQGGMGIVFEAFDEQLKRPVALKVLQPETQTEAKARERFLEEARACAALRHDNIVPLYQVAEDNNVIFLAMPLLQGTSLDRWIKKQTQPHVMQILRIGREIADGLSAAHAMNIVHRDIKLANIWLEAPKGRAVILDFGLAGNVESLDSERRKRECVGTSGYIAPEQVTGAVADHRVDLFSLGVVLYKLCTMQMPFLGSESIVLYYDALQNHQPPPPHELNPAIPANLSALVMGLLARSPAARPESAKLVRTILQQIQDEEVQKEVDRQRDPQELLKQGIIIPHDDTTSEKIEPTTSLTSYYVAKPRQRLSFTVFALALLLGCILAMGFWIYDKPNDDGRPDLVSSGPEIRHLNARGIVKQTGVVKAPMVNEASALIKSSKHPGLFYTLCDANNPTQLYTIDEMGKLHATLQVSGATNIDWEALTTDSAGNIYVGDIGNNLGRHRKRTIYRIVEPDKFTSDKPHQPQTVAITGTWHYTYPDKPFDAESLLFQGEHFWIISKARKLGETKLYRLPVAAEGKTTTIEEVGKLPKELLMVADASLSADARRLAMVNKFYAVIFPLANGHIQDILTAEPTYYEFDLYKVEGCAWDGVNLRMIAEDRKVYELRLGEK